MGLYYYHARYYDPQIGRFIQPDTTVQHPDDPQDLNRYSYVRNNPVNLVDPSGYGWLRKLFAAVAAIIVGVVVTIATGGHIEAGVAVAAIILQAGAAVAGDQVGAAIEKNIARNSSLRSDPGSSLNTPLGNQSASLASSASPGQSNPGGLAVGYSEAAIAAADLPLENVGLLEDPFFLAINAWQALPAFAIQGATGFAALGEAGSIRIWARAGGRLTGNALRAVGQAGEAHVERELLAEGAEIIGKQVSVRTSLGRRVIDFLVKQGDDLVAIEAKAGATQRTQLQVAKDVLIQREGGTIFGKNAPNGLQNAFRYIRTIVKRAP